VSCLPVAVAVVRREHSRSNRDQNQKLGYLREEEEDACHPMGFRREVESE
jgi:hypothetical protein